MAARHRQCLPRRRTASGRCVAADRTATARRGATHLAVPAAIRPTPTPSSRRSVEIVTTATAAHPRSRYVSDSMNILRGRIRELLNEFFHRRERMV